MTQADPQTRRPASPLSLFQKGHGVSGAGGARTPSPIREGGGSDCGRALVSAVPGSPHLRALRTLRPVASTCNLLNT